MTRRKICVVTGSRAEYGLLSMIMKDISAEPAFTLQLVVTGMHLSPEFGLTFREIEKDGFHIDYKVEMLLSSDTPVGIAKSLGVGIIGMADALNTLKPDLLILLGDRFEILAAAQAALVARIPVAHIAGGDTTEGTIDETIRHAITKMSHLHFVTNQTAAQRVLQLGENPSCVHMVGSPGIDRIMRTKLLRRNELEKELDFAFQKRNILVTFHPATLDEQPANAQCSELLAALDSLGSNLGIIFTMPNADTEGRAIITMIYDYTASRPNAKAYSSLGQLRYLSVMAQVDAVVGNSSSGLYEAPSFKKPAVNIGDRQKGRLQARSIVSCNPVAAEIARAVKEAFTLDCSETVNPYGDGNSVRKIVSVLKEMPNYSSLLVKHFYMISNEKK